MWTSPEIKLQKFVSAPQFISRFRRQERYGGIDHAKIAGLLTSKGGSLDRSSFKYSVMMRAFEIYLAFPNMSHGTSVSGSALTQLDPP